MQTKLQTYRSLQMCRAIAGMLVVLYHLGGAFGADKYFAAKILAAVMSVGHHSVVFFFVLSGFIMVRLHYDEFGKADRILSYLKKRAIRIYPAYLIVLTTVYVVARMIPALSHTVPHDPWILFKTALLLPQDRMVVGGTGAPILIVAWSMQYEMLFYALIGCFIVRKWLGILLVVALLFNYADCQLSGSCNFPRSFLASNFILPFFFGALAAWIVRQPYRLDDPLRIVAAAVAALAFMRGIDAAFGIQLVFHHDGAISYGVLSMVLIVALVHAEEAGLLTIHRLWGRLAASGYALYLLHFPIISVMCKLSIGLHENTPLFVGAMFVTTFVVCVAAAQIFHVLVEKPLVGRLLKSRQVPGAADSLKLARS